MNKNVVFKRLNKSSTFQLLFLSNAFYTKEKKMWAKTQTTILQFKITHCVKHVNYNRYWEPHEPGNNTYAYAVISGY